MTRLPRMPVIATVCAAVVLAGCSGEDSATDRIAYSADPSGEPTVETGIDEPVKMTEQVCYTSGSENLNGYRPADWDTESVGANRCVWSDPRAGRLEFEFNGDVAQAEAWQKWVRDSQTATRDDEIPGYALIRISRSDKSGNPLWHYQYTDDRGDSTVTIDTLNLYRGHWHITYQARAAEFNEYIAEQLEKKVDVAG